MHRIVKAAFLAVPIFLSTSIFAAETPTVDVYADSGGLTFEARTPNAGAVLTVSGPDGLDLRRTFTASETAFLSVADDELGLLPDGSYTYELRFAPEVDAASRTRMQRARAAGDDTGTSRRTAEGSLAAQGEVVFGHFTINGGALVTGGEEASLGTVTSAAASGLENVSAYDFVIADDLITQGSACIGLDCINNENFSFDTVRLKENNLRIHFDDTSVTAGFPANDWRILVNDTGSGGANFLAFEDSTAARIPFRVSAGALNNALNVSTGGRVGFGTATPVLNLHVASGNTPALRLEQNVSSGFTAQTWDVAGNEVNFFVRDATNGSTLPFRIFPSAPSNSLVLASTSGDVGMGTASPNADLHVRGTDGGTDLLVEEASAAEAARVLATLRNNGRALLLLQDTSADGTIWRWRTVENSMNLDADSGAGNELTLTSTGNMTILGTLTQNSNREAKTKIQAVDPQEVLAKVTAMPLATWAYKQSEDELHLGPMAQDFHQAFGLGAGNLGVAPYDTAGVALAAIQALSQKLEEKQERIDLLEARLAALEAKVTN